MDQLQANEEALRLRRERVPRPVPVNPTLHWRIYYADGRRVGSHESTWAAADRHNIVAVVQALNDEPAQVELGTPYYWHFGEWIGRVWDATLYLRQQGLVKFGRWAPHGAFDKAWREALKMIKKPDSDLEHDPTSLSAGAIHVAHAVGQNESGIGWAVFYDNGDLITNQQSSWKALPTDGVLCVVYAIVFSGIKHMYALRRFTYYYWRGHELINDDDLDAVLEQVPDVKWGQPHFVGRSYLMQAQALATALTDDLQDVRHAQ